MTEEKNQKAFTGKHFLMLIVSFFALIITVNLIMATNAISTFSGLSTDDAYKRGRDYNETLEAKRAQDDLGWVMTLNSAQTSGTSVALDLSATDKSGSALTDLSVTAYFSRPARQDMDYDAPFAHIGEGKYSVDANFPLSGRWAVTLVATDAAGNSFRLDDELWLKDDASDSN